jgi:hypothetical protein
MRAGYRILFVGNGRGGSGVTSDRTGENLLIPKRQGIPKDRKHRSTGPEARKQRESGAVRSIKMGMGQRELLSQHISSVDPA